MTDIAEVTSAPSEEAGAGRKRKGSGLDSMVLPELKQLASTLGLKGTGAMRKGQLIDAIQSAQSRQGGPQPNGAIQRPSGATTPRPFGAMATRRPVGATWPAPWPTCSGRRRVPLSRPSEHPENGAPRAEREAGELRGRARGRRTARPTRDGRQNDRRERRPGNRDQNANRRRGIKAAAVIRTRAPAGTTSRTRTSSRATGTTRAAAAAVAAGAAATGRTGAADRRWQPGALRHRAGGRRGRRAGAGARDLGRAGQLRVRADQRLPARAGGRVRLAVHGQEVRPAQGRRGDRRDPRSRARASARRSSTRWSGWRRSTAAIPSRPGTGSSSTS